MRQPRCSAVALMLASLVLIGDIANAFAPLPATRTTSYLAPHSDLDDDNMPISDTSRRNFFGATLGTAFSLTTRPQPSVARYVLDEATGDYVEVEDKPWQDEWRARLDEASTMSRDEIFNAARGAGNTSLKTGPESDASKKRRAMSACRDAGVRAKVGLKDEKECTARVFGGEVDFLLEAL